MVTPSVGLDVAEERKIPCPCQKSNPTRRARSPFLQTASINQSIKYYISAPSATANYLNHITKFYLISTKCSNYIDLFLAEV
jgi:hypothetical protein